ncbi:MAG: hypothetical protein H7326_05325 [Bdellovibrionaceae bacterium]|nr:hypothetical protein [Pseudobdellovibrionaceae bacterium]
MKASLRTALVGIALLGFISVGSVYAAEPTAATESHEGHHPETNAPAAQDAKAADGHDGMMGKMDMNGMMHECMEMHKDGKMCDHDMMAKCETKMGKGECQKMMKQAKKEHKKSKTK